MTGGLKQTASRTAMLAAAGILMGGMMVSPLAAADLGGDCCADLEERVAELEATTVRKGNRKVTVKLYGQVNRALLIWDDGIQSDVYSVDNDQASTRFGMTGHAAPVPGIKFGYRLEVEIQNSASDRVTNVISGVSTVVDDGGANLANAVVRHAVVWIQTARGKFSLGQTSQPSTGITEIDLSGSKVVATGRGTRWNNNFVMAVGGVYQTVDGPNNHTRLTWGNLMPLRGHLGGTRYDLVRYDSPNIAGFTVSAAWGEDDFWDAALRYAGTVGDFNVAAGLSYRVHNGTQSVPAGGLVGSAGDSEDNGNFGQGVEILAGSAGAIHMATGLNIHVAAGKAEHKTGTALSVEDNKFWYIKAGLKRKFLVIGPTAFYGEYFSSSDARNGMAQHTNSTGGLAGSTVTDDSAQYWGLGVVQHIPSAATELYIGYRHYSADIATADGDSVDFDDLDMVMGGMRIRF